MLLLFQNRLFSFVSNKVYSYNTPWSDCIYLVRLVFCVIHKDSLPWLSVLLATFIDLSKFAPGPIAKLVLIHNGQAEAQPGEILLLSGLHVSRYTYM